MSSPNMPSVLEIAQREPLAYSLQADGWGGFYVTESAHEAYGLQPIEPVTEGGRYALPGRKTKGMFVDVVLAGLEEMSSLLPEKARALEDQGWATAKHHGHGSTVLISLPDRSQIGFSAFDDLLNGLPKGASLDDVGVFNNDDEPVSLEGYVDAVTRI